MTSFWWELRTVATQDNKGVGFIQKVEYNLQVGVNMLRSLDPQRGSNVACEFSTMITELSPHIFE
jgi:hypothetical protein